MKKLTGVPETVHLKLNLATFLQTPLFETNFLNLNKQMLGTTYIFNT